MLMSSSTLLRGPPAPASQLRKQTAMAAPSSVVALPWPPAPFKVSRAPRLACTPPKNTLDTPTKHTYNILPTALVRRSVEYHDTWKIHEDKDRITLEFKVGAETEKEELEVATTQDHALLVIKYNNKGAKSGSSSPATELDVRLLMPPGYDRSKVIKAEIQKDGWLQIIITKPEPGKGILITKQQPTEQA